MMTAAVAVSPATHARHACPPATHSPLPCAPPPHMPLPDMHAPCHKFTINSIIIILLYWKRSYCKKTGEVYSPGLTVIDLYVHVSCFLRNSRLIRDTNCEKQPKEQ